MAANYDNSAWFYERLCRLMFGKALIRAQVYWLEGIPPGSKILIAGGGTGWILEEMANIHPSGLTITYVDISKNMMSRALKRNTGANNIDFVNKAVESVKLSNDYDVVITPFLFDNFTEGNFRVIFQHLHQCLKPKGLWLNTDFQVTGKWWQKVLLWSMFLFFRLICRIEANKLPRIKKRFAEQGYNILRESTFFGDFILSTVYQKDLTSSI